METQQKYVLTPIAGAVAAALCPAHQAAAQDDRDEFALEEIIVTATKREVSIQDIPASVQALTQETLAAMGAKNMEDYARFVPSLNMVNYGSSSNMIVFRGATTGSGWLTQATSSVYLDEISITQTGSQPSIRTVDVARIEALSGPQGTLYGSDAQAGTLRIITNQPVMNEFEAIFDGELRGGSEGEMSYRGSLVFNVPLVEDKLALRVVGFSDRDGGYIDNVYGHTADWHGPGDRSDPDNNFNPGGYGTLDNAASVEKDWNEDEILGGRVHLRWEMNDNWAATASYHYQKTEGGADSAMDPFVGDLEVVRFHDNWREEEFSMSSLKIEGDLGFAQLVGAVSYYDREVEWMEDATTYVHYWAAYSCHDSEYTTSSISYYDLDGNGLYDDLAYPYYWENPDTGYITWWPMYCAGESLDADYLSAYYQPSKEDKLTVEIRLQGGGDVFEWIVGGYYEESTDWWLDPYHTPTPGGRVDDSIAASLYQDSIAVQFQEWYYGEDLSHVTSNWSAGSNTDWEQTAFFGEMTWHINNWDLTVGGRYFDRSNVGAYWVNQPGRLFHDEGIIQNDWEYREANDGAPLPRKGEEKEFVPKVSASYHLSDDKMVYALYTEGQRQGGVNRSRGEPFFPTSFDSDLMKNHEVGYRSSFADGRGRLNLTYYYMAWEDYQLQALDPSFVNCIDPETGEELPAGDQPGGTAIPQVCGQPWQTVTANLGEAHISGYNVTLDYTPNENWVLGFNYENMEAETDSDHNLNDTPELEIEAGWRLPLTPDYKAAAWAEYHRPTSLLGADNYFVRLQWSFTGDSVSRLEPLSLDTPTPQFVNPGYNIGDIRVGLVGDDWQVDLFVNNLTDERAIYSYSSGPPIIYQAAQIAEGRLHHLDQYVNRPREFGVRYMKRWGD
jgi:outer membrane receptor protein involved in Fe transport